MKITNIKIHNYRNLDGVDISLAQDCNFIVGENNLGKSNLLSLLNIIFSYRAFQFDDFKEPDKPIEVEFQIKLADIEIGHFQDLFDADDYSIINIIARQMDADENSITFYHKETNSFIHASQVKCINYIHYDSLRNPSSEINFDKGKGVGKFLRNIISQYLEEQEVNENEFIDEKRINELLKSINDKVSKIKSFKDFGIVASPEDNTENLLSKIVVFKDGKGDSLSKTGYGVQFLILVTLSILEKLQLIQQQRGDRGIFEDEATGTKSISLVLGLDEPEIHLHPYMQRSLIKYINSIISNSNPDFKLLIKELFGIDEFIGQVIVVTHSPNIILNDFKQIIRFYSLKGETKVISGNKLNLPSQSKKHLYLQFPFIKEAFFSRCVIFVEGDSEYASLPHFGTKMAIEFDDFGICIIQSRGGGENAVSVLIDLVDKFGIPAVGVSDKDNGTHPPTVANHFETDLRDFEAEIIALIDGGKESILRAILTDLDSNGIERQMEKEALTKRAHRVYGIGAAPFTQPLKLRDIPLTDLENLRAFYLTWFSINKSYPLGMLIGTHFTVDEIPSIYKKVIEEAQKIVIDSQKISLPVAITDVEVKPVTQDV